MCVYWANQARQHRFWIFWIQKNAFWTKQSDLSKKYKQSKFSERRWSMRFVNNWPSFQFRQYRAGKCVLLYSRTKKPLSRLQKQQVQKGSCQGVLVHGFGKKLAIFPSFILGNIGQENVFYHILEPKTPLQTIKTISSKSRKNEIFPQGLVHAFSQKLAIFPSFYFWYYRHGKCVLPYSKTKKKPFQAIKITS